MNSTNIKVMSEEIQHLKNEVHNLDVEIPAHPATDAGKYLGVAADGTLAWSKVPDELPLTTEATAGQILALDSDKNPAWVNLPVTDIGNGVEFDTGFKFGGDTLYGVIKTGLTPETAGTFYVYQLPSEASVVSLDFRIFGTNLSYGSLQLYKSGSTLYVSVSQATANIQYYFWIYYTKPTPSALTSSDPTREAEPEIIEEIETKSTRTKKSTK